MDTGDQRFEMWCSTIPGYLEMSPRDRKQAKTEYALSIGYNNFGEVPLNTLETMKAKLLSSTIPDVCYGFDMYAPKNMMVTIDDCPKAAIPCAQECKANKNKEKNMYDMDMDCEYTSTETERTKDFLNSRLSQAFSEKDDELIKAFHLRADPPENEEDQVKRILAGEYEFEDRDCSWSGRKYKKLIWRNPKTPADKAGYDVASAKLNAACEAAREDVKVLAPEKGLETLRAFQSATFH